MPLLVLAVTAAAGQPSAEALQLGRKLATQGTLASLLPIMKASQTEELLKEDQSLSPADRMKLHATADRVFAAGYERVMNATGEANAQQLGIDDLRSLVSFFDSPAARKYRATTPSVVMAAVKALDGFDFKKQVRLAYCAETKRLCNR